MLYLNVLFEVKGVMGQAYGDMKKTLDINKSDFQKNFNKIPKSMELYRQAMVDNYSSKVRDAVGSAREQSLDNFSSYAKDIGIAGSPKKLNNLAQNQLSAYDGTQEKQDMLKNFRYKPNAIERVGDNVAKFAQNYIPGVTAPDTRIQKENLPWYYRPNVDKSLDGIKEKISRTKEKMVDRFNTQPQQQQYPSNVIPFAPIV